MSDSISQQTRTFPKREEIIANGPFPIRFPGTEDLEQDEEWCEVQVEGNWQRVRFHDYHEIFEIPGLYETIFYRTLHCNSPFKIVEVLRETLKEHYYPPEDLSVLDVGAGNGMVGEALQYLGIRKLVGIDIIPEAKMAAERDRPWVYYDYLVEDLTDLSDEAREKLEDYSFNALTAVAALGFGDIPVKAFCTAYNLVKDGGWIAFNIKEDFLQSQDSTGFAGIINRMTREGICQLESYKRYSHRLSVSGDPLYYIAVTAQKLSDVELT